MEHSAFVFGQESKAAYSDLAQCDVPTGALVSIVQVITIDDDPSPPRRKRTTGFCRRLQHKRKDRGAPTPYLQTRFSQRSAGELAFFELLTSLHVPGERAQKSQM
ncbi:hypothetical protein OSTOST_23057, partial [Ostertagia ostertagi]